MFDSLNAIKLGFSFVGIIAVMTFGLFFISERKFTVEDNVTANGIPSGAVIAFDLKKCPSGWSEYTQAYGRFVRGIDKSGTSIDQDGLRDPGSLQDDQIIRHSHLSPAKTWSKWSGGSKDMLVIGGGQEGPDRQTSEIGGQETRPKNVSLLYCVKE